MKSLTLVPMQHGADLTTVEAVTRGEIDTQVATAKRYPRNPDDSIDRARALALRNPDTASSCYYTLPRKDRSGKDVAIEGPSVRLAEIVASQWGHLRTQGRVLDVTDKEVVAEGTAWDMETNYLARVEVRRSIVRRDGRRFSDDLVTTVSQAAVSIALRNAIFRVIPRTVVEEIYQEARQLAAGDARTLETRRARALAKMAKMGVDEKRALAAVKKDSVADLDGEDLATLNGLFNAVRDGDADIDVAFPGPSTAAQLEERLTQKADQTPQAAPEGAQDAPESTKVGKAGGKGSGKAKGQQKDTEAPAVKIEDQRVPPGAAASNYERAIERAHELDARGLEEACDKALKDAGIGQLAPDVEDFKLSSFLAMTKKYLDT